MTRFMRPPGYVSPWRAEFIAAYLFVYLAAVSGMVLVTG